MSNSKELKTELETVSTIEDITSVYQGIASLRMNQIKDSVAKTREFIDGLAEIYEHAKTAYIAILQKKLKDKKSVLSTQSLDYIKRNGKTLTVFISANEHLYGSLILEVWKAFLQEIKNNGGDIVIIGKFGKSLYDRENLESAQSEVKHQLFYFDLSDDKPESAQIKKIIDFVIGYERIIVHYGQMRTLLTQEPKRSEITGSVALEKPIKTDKKYLFEPSPEAIIAFFETEIIAALFNQRLLENQLARYSSRMVAMDQATQNADLLIKKLKVGLGITKKQLANKAQLEAFSGINFWEKEEDNG